MVDPAPFARTAALGAPSLTALSPAVEGGAVLVGVSGGVDFVSPGTAELHEGHAFRPWWSWIHERLTTRFDVATMRAEGADGVELELPEDLGGRTLFVRCFPIDE